MFKAVVFDMDGVLLDSEKIYRVSEKQAAAHFGLPLDNIDEFCEMIQIQLNSWNSLKIVSQRGWTICSIARWLVKE